MDKKNWHSLVKLVFYRKTLFVVEDFYAKIVALLSQFFAAWLAYGRNYNDLVCRGVAFHLERINKFYV